MTAPRPAVVAVVGPTAAGKSALSLALAHELGGEVVNADSMQLYRGMDIGTAKLTVAEREGVPHHVLDIWDVTEPASVAEYQRAGPRRDRRHRRPRAGCRCWSAAPGSTCGRSWRTSTSPAPTRDLRAALEAELAQVGPAALHARLRAADPEAAERILPGNGRRIVRALEVIALTGSAVHRRAAAQPRPVYDALQLGVDLDTGGARRADRARGSTDVGRRAWSTRCARWTRAACATGRTASRGARLPAGAALSRRGLYRRARRTARRSAPPGGSCAGSAPGSAATAGSSGSTVALPTDPTAAALEIGCGDD